MTTIDNRNNDDDDDEHDGGGDATSYSAATTTTNDDDQQQQHQQERQSQQRLRLHHWPSVTTRLLRQGGNSSSWNVMDQVLSEDACNGLQQEIYDAHLIDKLQPAKTKGESDTDAMLALLFKMQQQQQQEQQQSTTTTNNNTRGDKSLFLSREYRSRPEFGQRHPYLQEFIVRVTNTIAEELNGVVSFHLSQTSVQLAVYPGDGSSGYPRHCDRGQDSCREEQGNKMRNDDHDNTTNSNIHPKRIITAVYYLTDDDWNEQDDGGCLRVFSSSSRDSSSSTTTTNFHDVIPYRNRMIVFRSDGVEHQVMPSLRRNRMALTIWMYGHVLKSTSNTTTTSTTTDDNGTMTNEKKTTTSEIVSPVSQPNPSATITADSSPGTNKAEIGTTATTTTSDSDDPPPLPIPTSVGTTAGTDEHHLPTIFVSIASFRDSETTPTLQSLFSMAKHPERIFVGLVLQLEEDDEYDKTIWKNIRQYTQRDLEQTLQHNIRMLRLDARHSTGPCNARAQCQTLFRDEDYVLQIDSHMRFRQNWDEYLIHQYLKLCNNNTQKIVLTTYPVGYQLLPNGKTTIIPNKDTRGTLLVPWKFDDTGMLRQRGRLFQPRTNLSNSKSSNSKSSNSKSSSLPLCHYLYAAGFNFGPSSMIHDVPYDPNLHQLFFGEEVSMALRLYTHGYELVAPPETVVYHLWSRAHRPTQSGQKQQKRNDDDDLMKAKKAKQRQASLAVVRNQIKGSSNNNTKYGLGTVRTVEDFWKALKVDIHNETLQSGCENGPLEPNDFCDSTNLYPDPDSIESKVASLDPNAKKLIAFFLGGVNTTSGGDAM